MMTPNKGQNSSYAVFMYCLDEIRNIYEFRRWNWEFEPRGWNLEKTL